MTTVCLSAVMMAGLFLMLWGAVGFVQDTRFFGSAPKEVLEVLQPKDERFAGQRILGWAMLILSTLMMGGALAYGIIDGIRNGFGFWQLFVRLVIMLLLLKAFDILFFDWFLLCRSNFFPRYYPETKAVLGPDLFGFNRRSHLVQTALIIACSFATALIFALL